MEQDQRKRIIKVLQHIEQNLDQKLSLKELAKISSYSDFHFHRLFNEMMGETPADYVKRIRMEKAAHSLIYEPHTPITEVAMNCGFSSLSYFTSAFSEYYHHSPKAWREGAYLEIFPRPYLHSKKSKVDSRKSEELDMNKAYTEFQWLDLARIKTVMLEERHMVFTKRFGTYSQDINNSWESIFRWANARDFLTDQTSFIGIPQNNPYLTPPEKCRYDCCVSMPAELVNEDIADVTFFKGGKYVIYEFEHPVEYKERSLLIECYSELYSFWLPRSGYRYLGNPIELVKIETRQDTMDLECLITAIALEIEPK